MGTSDKKFNAKVLLIGEYTVTLGSGALAVPFGRYGGQWSQNAGNDAKYPGLKRLLDHILSNTDLSATYRTDDFARDLNAGMWFDADIPEGYGLGSSGALVAAFYDAYAVRKTSNLHDLKSLFAYTENAFHGASSGIDPLVSYLGKPLLYRGEQLDSPSAEIDLHSFFLLDTGKARNTGQLVQQFRESLTASSAFRKAISRLSDCNDEAIECLLQGNSATLFDLMGTISQIQYEHMRPMIPEAMVPLWKKGLDRGHYLLKLCGAGGGGMMMGLRANSDLPDDDFAPFSLSDML